MNSRTLKPTSLYCQHIFTKILVIFLLSLPVIGFAQPLEDSKKDSDRQTMFDVSKGRVIMQLPYTPGNRIQLENNINLLSNRLVYVPFDSLSTRPSPTLHIGFFSNETEAEEALENTGLTGVTLAEISSEDYLLLTQIAYPQASMMESFEAFMFPVQEDASTVFREATKPLLDQAQDYYKNGMYGLATYHYQLISHIADEESAAWALELLGLCYSRMGYMDLAITTYQNTLEKFPDASGIARIEQRLRSLETAANDAQASLREADTRQVEKQMFTRGSFGQYSRTLYRSINDEDQEQIMSLISTNFDVRSGIQNADYSVQMRLNGYYSRDAIRSDRSQLRLNRGFAKFSHVNSGLDISLGRQKDPNNGVFTSYDGLTVAYPLRDNLKVAASAGKPAYFSDIYDSLDFIFYSTSMQWDVNDSWKLSGYFNYQTLNGVTSREALGLRTQYRNKDFNTSFAMDYDIAFAEINNLLWDINFSASEKIKLGASLGQQRSPFLSASNILIGQADLDIELYLQTKENQDTLLSYALDRTSLNRFITLSLNVDLTEKVDFLANLYRSTQSEIPSPEFLQGLMLANENPLEFSQENYSMQINSNGLLHEKENTAIGIRRTMASGNVTTQYFLNERVRLNNTLSLAAKASYGDSEFSNSNETRTQLRYSMTATYRPWRNREFNLEVGQDSFISKLRDTKVDNLYLYAGYRLDF